METADAGSCHVGEVMGTELFTLTPDTVVASARRLAWGNGVRHLLVLDGGTLTGIVCDEDLRTAARDALVGELMRTPVLCIAPDTTLDEATELMEEHGVSCLPVVKGTELVGIVTREGLASLTGGAEAEADVCVACGASEEVRRDPRAGMVALCADCLGRKLPSILASSTS
ncbi:MAG TPA: CBS domain-containing protein [Polyangia bacterium]|jgi:CBS domain-containing protein